MSTSNNKTPNNGNGMQFPVNGSAAARAQVMLEFQRASLEMTRKFLETQQNVMIAYLSGGGVPSGLQELGAPYVAQPLSYPSALIAESPNGNGSNGHEHVAPSLLLSTTTPIQPQQISVAPTQQAAPTLAAPSNVAQAPVAQVSGPSSDQLIDSLIEIVSERTGYPPDMLDPALDLEADLGIDSIKRVEILNSFRKLLPEEKQLALEGGIEQLAGVKTLQGIMDWIRNDLAALGGASAAAAAPSVSQGIAARGPRISGAPVLQIAPGTAQFTVTMDTSRDLYLNDHTFDGVPVMPMAMALELMLEAAASLYPTHTIIGIDDMKIPAGIVFENSTKDLLVLAETETASPSLTAVRVSVQTEGALKRTHFKALVRLAPQAVFPPEPPSQLPITFNRRSFLGELETMPTLDEIYGTMMFHGPLFQGITSVSALGADGIIGGVAPKPITSLLANPAAGEDWKLNPVVLDSAMQVAGVWARQHLEVTVLPNGFEQIHIIGPLNEESYRVIVAVPPETTGLELKCDLAIYSNSGQMVLLINGLKGIGSKSLNRLAGKQPQAGSVK